MGNHAHVNTARLIEPLTRREQDILKLLALNLTDREIADRLTLALSSVKWYARQVYAKLTVENRHQAIDKARQLGLLPLTSFSRRAHNLPRQITRLIGREKEIARVVEMIWEYSLITLTGSGGVGKTRLAIAAAEELLDDFANGVWFVEIAPLSDPLLVERTLADVLGVREEPGRSLRDSLILYLQERQALLIFDNCEHMLDACAALASDLLKSLPSLKVLVSSREPLGVTGEAVFRVPSLSFPKEEKALPLDQIQEFEAVCLFVERARAALPDFNLNEQNAAFVAQICRRVDGIPLAIVLAASRISSLDVAHIASRLDQAFRLLSGGSRNGLDRHRTLRAAVDWSYNLLTVQERMLLRRLSVFVGGCTLEAAESVCSGEGIEQDEILDLLSRLVDKSMLVVEQSPAGEVRYRLLETLRQYAEEKQDDPLEIERLRRMHCDWFVQFAERAGLKMSMGEDRIWHKKLDADVDNLRAALGWSIDQRADPQAGMRIINALVHEFWKFFPYVSEAEQWAEKGMHELSGLASIDPLLQVRSLASLNEFYLGHSHPPDMQRFEQIVALCLKLGDKGALIHANLLWYSGFVLALKTGDLQTGLEMLKQSEAMLRSIIGQPAKLDLSTCLVGLTWVSAQLGDLQAALAYAQESSDITHEMGSMRADIDLSLGDVQYWLGNYAAAEKIYQKAILADPEAEDFYRKLGDVYRAQRRYDQAISKYREALSWTIEFSHWHNVVWLQCCFAFTAVGQARDLPPKQPEEAAPLLLYAARLLGALQPVMAETGEILPVEYQGEYDRDLAALRERLDPSALEAAWAEGCEMNRKQVVAYLLEDGDHPEWEID